MNAAMRWIAEVMAAIGVGGLVIIALSLWVAWNLAKVWIG